MGIEDEVRARRYGTRLSAQRLFTNRTAEIALFDAKLAALRQRRRSEPAWSEKLGHPRRNVLVFHGYGGIGKSSLSRELERQYLQGDAGGSVPRVAVRVDFSEPSARDSELYLLALRAGLSRLASTFPAFDSALAIYWSRQHPGTPVTEFVQQQTVLGGVTDRSRLVEQLREFTQDLLDSAGPAVGAARRLIGLSWETIRNSHTIRQLRDHSPFYEQCVTESDLDILRLHLPLLLAWDLNQLKDQADIDVAVFLDTFEHVTHGRGKARKQNLEDTIARSAFFLPTTAFVLTTRRQLTWADPHRSATLEFAGPELWPGLADTSTEPLADASSDETDQHEIGVLPERDREDHLRRCILTADGEPAIPAPLRQHIGALSHGVPLYLDVAANHFLALTGSGQEPKEQDFPEGVAEIVLRLMDDLNDDESDLLRVVSLLGVFDETTLRAALPHIRASTVRSFLGRTFVVDRDDDLFSVHELLQASVRSQDAATTNPWSAEEWQQVQERLVAHWAAQFQDRDAQLWRDRRTQALAFWQLCGLYATTGHNLDVDVLAEAAMTVQLQGHWAVLDAGREQPPSLLSERGTALLQLLDGILARQVGRLDETEALLSEALASPVFTGDLNRLARYYLGETIDLQSRSAAHLYEQLTRSQAVSTDDRIGTEARIAHAHALTRDGDLVGALAIAEQFPAELDDAEIRYRLHELLGTIMLSAGELDAACHHFEVSRQVGEAKESALLQALGLRHLALSLCWAEPDKALGYLEQAEPLNRDLHLPPGVGQCLTARAVSMIGSAPVDEVIALLDEADTVFTQAGYRDDAVLAVAASVFAAAVTGDAPLTDARHRSLVARSEGHRVRSWLAVGDAWASTGTTSERFDRVCWPYGRAHALDRWRAPLLARQRPNHIPPPGMIGPSSLPFSTRMTVEMM